jgi:hypothetical protein
MMGSADHLRNKVFNVKNKDDFRALALEVFSYQFDHNAVYHDFISSLKRSPAEIKSIDAIPFMPVEFFRSHKIQTGNLPVEMVFESSGTTGFVPGRHYINDLSLYEESFITAFRLFYGDPEDFLITALLPSYTEREGSSLVYMADNLIKRSQNPSSGFYRDDIDKLISVLSDAGGKKQKVLLLGVSFALLDLAEKYSPDLSGVIVMETGGMKGRRKEVTRSELHSVLKKNLNITSVHSEYGMTELLSQAYSKGDGIFHCPPWMNIIIRDPQDPLTMIDSPGKAGGINIIDLANIHSCSFIATGDLGKKYEDDGFKVLGRFDNSDVRGCNLMAE